jgi:hypothetical protein
MESGNPTLLVRVLDAFFGCRHRLSRPITIVCGKPPEKRTYVVCLECGREFPYDLATMKVGKAA